jgi:hypothetical protein
MKIRNGFVSNSSSASFVAFIPKNFLIETTDISSEAKLLFKILVKQGYLYEFDIEEIHRNNIEIDEEGLNEAYFELTDFLSKKNMIITSIDTPSDSGNISLVEEKHFNEVIKMK